jgi:tetratricopeptide (TPR) repeat protein
MTAVAGTQTDNASRVRLAEAAMRKSDWNAACMILETDATDLTVREKLSFCLSRAKRYEEAIECLGQLRNEQPGNFKWAYMLGYQFYEQERFEDALPFFVDAWKLNPRHLRNLYRLAQTRLRLGEPDKAKRGAAEVLRLWDQLPPDRRERENGTMAKAAYLLGREEMKTSPAKAVKWLRLAAEHDPGDANRHYLLGKALRKDKRSEEAVEHLRRAARMRPGQVYIELELATACSYLPAVASEAAEILGRLDDRLSDWQALKGASLAVTLKDADSAHRLLARAARKRFVQRSPAFEVVKEKVNRLESDERPKVKSTKDAVCEGRVDMVDAKRKFGFLVDLTDEQRRYFKLPRNLKVRRGDKVCYEPQDADKGPAARVRGLRD